MLCPACRRQIEPGATWCGACGAPAAGAVAPLELVLADLTRQIARAGVDLDLVYVATRNRVVFGAHDLDALKAALGEP